MNIIDSQDKSKKNKIRNKKKQRLTGYPQKINNISCG